METAAAKIARLNRSIARTGQTVTLQRTAVDAGGTVTVTEQIDCPAHIRASQPQDISAVEGRYEDVTEIRIILSSTYLAQTTGSPPVAFGLPRVDDIALVERAPAEIKPTNVKIIKPIYYGGQLVRVELLCRG